MREAVNPISVITNIYGVSIGVAAILAVGMITWAGIQYATTEAVTGKSDAKGHWEGAIWGLVILLGSYIMLRTINVDLVNINLDLGKPNGGSTVSLNPLEDLENAVTTSVNALAHTQQNVDSIQKNAEAKVATLNETVKNLWSQLQDPSLSATDKEALQKKYSYATAVLSFEQSNAKRASLASDTSKAIASRDFEAANSSFTSFIKSVNDEIDIINSSRTPSEDSTTKNALDQRVLDLTAQKKELSTVKNMIDAENDIYSRAINIYGSTNPSKPGLTAAEFKDQLLAKTIILDGKEAAPISLMQTTATRGTVSHPEVDVIGQSYTSTYSQNLNTAIQNRVNCYQTFTSQGAAAATAAGCAPFGNG